jgi:hypothetical protein
MFLQQVDQVRGITILTDIPLTTLFYGCKVGDQWQHLEDLDDISMCAALMTILHDQYTCQSLLSRRGPEAQSLIDLLQEVHLNFVFSYTKLTVVYLSFVTTLI